MVKGEAHSPTHSSGAAPDPTGRRPRSPLGQLQIQQRPSSPRSAAIRAPAPQAPMGRPPLHPMPSILRIDVSQFVRKKKKKKRRSGFPVVEPLIPTSHVFSPRNQLADPPRSPESQAHNKSASRKPLTANAASQTPRVPKLPKSDAASQTILSIPPPGANAAPPSPQSPPSLRAKAALRTPPSLPPLHPKTKREPGPTHDGTAEAERAPLGPPGSADHASTSSTKLPRTHYVYLANSDRLSWKPQEHLPNPPNSTVKTRANAPTQETQDSPIRPRARSLPVEAYESPFFLRRRRPAADASLLPVPPVSPILHPRRKSAADEGVGVLSRPPMSPAPSLRAGAREAAPSS